MSAVGHRRLVNAVATGDPDTARNAVDVHLRRRTARTLLDADSTTSGRRVHTRRSDGVDSQRLAIDKYDPGDGRGPTCQQL